MIELAGGAAMSLECAVDTFTDPAAAATDACDPEVALVAGGAQVDPATVGTYLLTYDAADACGNAAAQAVRTVTVADTLAPDLVGDPTPTLVTGADCLGSVGEALATSWSSAWAEYPGNAGSCFPCFTATLDRRARLRGKLVVP